MVNRFIRRNIQKKAPDSPGLDELRVALRSEAHRVLTAENPGAITISTLDQSIGSRTILNIRILDEQVSEADIECHVLRRLVLRADAQPGTVVIRQRSEAMLGIGHRCIVVGDTGTQLDLLVELVVGTDSKTPSVLELGAERLDCPAAIRARSRNDVDIGYAAPAGPGVHAHRGPAEPPTCRQVPARG